MGGVWSPMVGRSECWSVFGWWMVCMVLADRACRYKQPLTLSLSLLAGTCTCMARSYVHLYLYYALCLPLPGMSASQAAGPGQHAHAHTHLHRTPQASIPCILYVSMVANSGPYLKGGDDHTSEAASLYSFSNHTITNTTLCPEMAGLESQRGATLDAQKIMPFTGAVSMGAFAIAINSVALVRDLSLLTLTMNICSQFISQPGSMPWITQ